MPIPVVIDLAVGLPDEAPGDHPPFSLADTEVILAAAVRTGVTAVRIRDRSSGPRTLDPTIVTAHLAGRFGDIGYLADVPTTAQAPYNLARRILSTDRATGGRYGLVLRTGSGDEVSDAILADPGAVDPADRWTEYAQVLTALWESFPQTALIGDQAAALVVDDRLITPIGHDGRAYRVAGPLDGPSSVQGRPVLVAADLDGLGWPRVAETADVVILDRLPGADLALTAATEQAGRTRRDLALLGLIDIGVDSQPGELLDAVTAHRLDGLVLRPDGDAHDVAALLHRLVPALEPTGGLTLRAGLGLPVRAGVPA